MSEIGKNFDIFVFLQSLLSHFPTKSANIFVGAYWVLYLIFVERLPIIVTPKRF